MLNQQTERIQELYQEAQSIEERLEFIDKQKAELEEFKQHLAAIENSPEKEILAQIGKGVFAKSALVEKEFFIDVGAGVMIKKNAADISSTINQQIIKMGEIRQQSLAHFLEINRELEQMVKKIKDERNAN